MAESLYPNVKDSKEAKVTVAIAGNYSKFFRNLTVKATAIASEEAKRMADSMVYILRHRQTFKVVGGHYPRWDGSNGIPSNRSFDAWAVTKWGKDYWAITNNAAGYYKGDEFSYPHLLMKGVGAPKGWVKGQPKSIKLVRVGNKYFSSQMPQGITPWVKIKREDLKNKIRKRFKEGAHRV